MDYDREMLRKVQLVQAEILEKFADFCEEKDLSYQLFGGTLLGAIRHKGFIPWDDDIDIAMARDDYEKLLKLWDNKQNKKYFLQNQYTDPEYHRLFSRLRKNGTLFKQDKYKHLDIHHGIFIDIFPLDDYAPETFSDCIRTKKIKVLSYFNKGRSEPIQGGSSFKRIFWELIYLSNKLMNKRKFHELEKKIISQQNSDAPYLTHFTNGARGGTYLRFKMKKEDFYDMTMTQFEGREYPIPKNYNKYLTNIYGDYMKLPPEEERTPHHGVIEVEL